MMAFLKAKIRYFDLLVTTVEVCFDIYICMYRIFHMALRSQIKIVGQNLNRKVVP